jgi:hypothetical protein
VAHWRGRETHEPRRRVLIQVSRRIPACLRMRDCNCGISHHYHYQQCNHPRITERYNEVPQYVVRIAEKRVRDAARDHIEPGLGVGVGVGSAAPALAGQKVELSLDLDLDDRRVTVDKELARGAAHDVKVVARQHVLDAPKNLVVVFVSRLSRLPAIERDQRYARQKARFSLSKFRSEVNPSDREDQRQCY